MRLKSALAAFQDSYFSDFGVKGQAKTGALEP
jgi:hypothetical protein